MQFKLTVSVVSFVCLIVSAGCGGGASRLSSSDGGPPGGWPAPPQEFQANPVNLSAVWANEGGDKVARQEVRASKNPTSVVNAAWKDNAIRVFGAKNEVVSFNVILEAATKAATEIKVNFNQLEGPGNSRIVSSGASGDGVFNYTNRDIELFFVRYLKIRGLSRLGYETYDERHTPGRLQRPWSGDGVARGGWVDRPDHDMDYPDIAVPIEAAPNFSVAAGTSQSIWSDIYIPKNAAAGVYDGVLSVMEGGNLSYVIPVQVYVRNLTLPEVPNSKTMLYMGYPDIANRYVGQAAPTNSADTAKVQLVRDRHFQMAHRHKIAMIDSNYGVSMGASEPTAEWRPRLNGSLFTSAQGYRGPGEGQGNGIFSIGTYGGWNWKGAGQAAMWSNTDGWANWFAANAPSTERFLYLDDESSNFAEMQMWASQMQSNPGPGRALASMATLNMPLAVAQAPAMQVMVSTLDVGDTQTWDNALATLRQSSGKRFYLYNGKRPASGSFMTDDDGTALRELPWGQYKKGIDRWFYWESTYYNDFQGGRGQIDVMNNAQTFGSSPSFNSVNGMTGGLYANGDGVLFYPGTDRVFPGSSYNLGGPIASLRLKHWRRGIQDVDYLALAMAKNPTKARAVLNATVWSVLWENGVTDRNDPSWTKCDIGWSPDPAKWESARAQLADIAEGL